MIYSGRRIAMWSLNLSVNGFREALLELLGKESQKSSWLKLCYLNDDCFVGLNSY